MASTELVKSLDQMWEDARLEFMRSTKPPVDIGRKAGVMPGEEDSLMGKLRAAYDPQTDSPTKDKAVRIVGDVMKLVQVVGGLAATAASTVFSPAGMCFNAVSFLIDGVTKIKNFHSDLANLFGSIQSFLINFRMMQRVEGSFEELGLKNLPTELIMTTNKLMASFVRICLLAHKSITRGKFKSAMVDLRIAFTEDDGGVRAELNKFKSLIEEQDSTKGTITLEQVMNTRVDISKLLEKAQQQSADITKTYDVAAETNEIITLRHSQEVSEKRLQDIARKLRISSDKDAKDPPPLWREQTNGLEEYKKNRLPGSGGWLSQLEAYRDWQTGSAHPVLCLRGRKDTGKSIVASRVIDECSLQTGTGARPAVAYFFFGLPKDRRDANDKLDAMDDPKAISRALCCMAYMLAKSSPTYAKKLDTLSRDRKDELELSKLPPKKLLDVLQFTKAQQTSLYLIFDGLDQVTGGEVFVRDLYQLDKVAPPSATDEPGDKDAAFASQSRLYQPKFFVTINPDECDLAGRGTQMSFIDLCNEDSIANRMEEARNISDLELFIDESINAENSLLAPHAKDETKLFSDFKEKLLEISDGKYTTIENRLLAVNQRIEGSEVQKISDLKEVMLSDESDDLGNVAKQVLGTLETTLSAVDIAQINDILVWCTYSFSEAFTLEELDAIAALNKDSSTLQKFSQKLKNRRIYHKLFRQFSERGETRVVVHEKMDDWLRINQVTAAGPNLEVQDDEKPKISLTITIHQAEPKAVKRFLWDVLEKLTYDESFFSISGSQVEAKGKIGINDMDGSSKILYQSLNLLIDEPAKDTEILRLEAFKNLPLYVWRVRDMIGPSFPELNAIVTKLATFFNSDGIADFIKQCVESNESPVYTWLMDTENIATMDQFLDRSRLPMLPPEQRRTLKLLLDKCDGFGGYLFHITSEAGHGWLLDETWSAANTWFSPFSVAFSWVDRYLSARKEWRVPDGPKPSDTSSSEPAAGKSSEPSTEDVKAETTPDSARASPSPNPVPISSAPTRQDSMPMSPSLARQDSLNPLTLTTTSDPEAAETQHEEPEEPEEPEMSIRIAQAADWVQKSLGIAERSGVFLERLGMTFYYNECSKEAIETFTKALELSDNRARIHRRLAKVYGTDDKFEKAIEEARQGLTCCDSLESKSEQANETREIKKILADIHTRAKRPDEAVNILSELIEVNAEDWEVYRDLLEISFEHKQTNTAHEILHQLSNTHRRNEIAEIQASYLAELLCFVAESCDVPDSLLWQAHSAGLLDRVIEGLEQALLIQQKKSEGDKKMASIKLATIRLTRGHAHALHDRGIDGFRKGYESWYEAIAVNQWWLSYQAASAAASYHYAQLLSSASPTIHLKKIKEIIDKSKISQIASILAYAYVVTDQVQLAKTQMRVRVQTALELLDDDDPENDWEGYKDLARPLASCGDVANALAARSLINPDLPEQGMSETEKEAALPNGDGSGDAAKPATAAEPTNGKAPGESTGIAVAPGDPQPSSADPATKTLTGPLGFNCDGRCGKRWTYPDDYWECKVCDDVQFCTPCLENLKGDKLSRWICHKTHSWFYNPPWTREEYDRVPKDSVCIPREVADGQWSREQGEIIGVAEWKQRIKKSWNIN